MPRKPTVTQEDPSQVTARVAIPKGLWSVFIRVGREQARVIFPRLQLSDDRAGVIGAQLILTHAARQVADGDTKWLGTQFNEALTAVRDENFGTIAVDGAPVDVNLLHRSQKVKSGFHGVYANGVGFRAMGRDFSGRSVVVGTFKTAEEAAWRRRTYYVQHNLPYGELEEEMDAWRKNAGKWGISADISDDELIHRISEHCQIAGTWDSIFGPTCVSIRPAVSRKLPTREEALARRAVPTVPQALVDKPSAADDGDGAEQPLEDEQPFGFDPNDLPESLQ